MPPENHDSPPDSAEGLTNIHGAGGIDDFARRRLWPGTIAAIEAHGLDLRGDLSGGATAVVLEARDRATGRRLAIKVIVEPSNTLALACFRREVKVLGSDHVPLDVVPQLRFVQDVDNATKARVQPFLVMEKIDGKPILDYVNHPRPMAMADRISVVEQCFVALDRLHSCNLLHGDVSFNNVMIQKGDIVRLIDLGQAKTRQGVGTRSVSGAVGSPICAPDGRIRGEEPLKDWIDIHSLAIVAFFTLTGLKPETKPRDEAASHAALLKAGVPTGVARVLLKAMRDKDERKAVDPTLYQSAADVAKDLRLWREGQARRALRKRQALVCFLVTLPVFALAGWCWSMYQAEVRADRGKQIAALRRELEGLSQANHSLVKKLEARASQLYQDREAALNRGETSRVDALTTDLLATYSELIALRRGLEHSLPMREGLGKILNKMKWVEESEAIIRKRDKLAADYTAIIKKFDGGETKSAWDELYNLGPALAELAGENTLALQVSTPRARLNRTRNSLSAKLRDQGKADPDFVSLAKDAEAAETAWNLGDWNTAERLFGMSQHALEKWLEGKETPEELAVRLQGEESTAKKAAQRERELRDQIEGPKGFRWQIGELQTQITTLNGQNLRDRAAYDQAKKDLEGEKTNHGATRKDLTAKIAAALKAKGDVETERDGERKTVESQKVALADKESKLQLALKDVETWKTRAESRPAIADILKSQAPSSAEPIAGWVGKKAGDLKIIRLKGKEIRLRWCPPCSLKDQVHVLITQGFWMMEIEFTQGLWQAAGGFDLKREFGQSPDHPVYNVSYNEIVAFLVDLNKQLHDSGELPAEMELVLPTEAQWEYAARADEPGRFSFGDNESKLRDYAWYRENSEGKSHPVGTKEANNWGIRDMAGNVSEWCSDGYNEKFPGGTNPSGTEGATGLVIRGGCWVFIAQDCRSASRFGYPPQNRYSYVGFRLVAVQSPR